MVESSALGLSDVFFALVDVFLVVFAVDRLALAVVFLAADSSLVSSATSSAALADFAFL